LHLEPEEDQVASSPKVDVFDDLIGVKFDVNIVRPVPSDRQGLRVRLEYDDATIAAETATAYLLRFQHHLESPSELVI
jgi:uncharacterized protein (UPF0335 family)